VSRILFKSAFGGFVSQFAHSEGMHDKSQAQIP
jgi:hypothetical protein